MKRWSTSSSLTCEARSGGDPTLAASQIHTILPRNASQAIAMVYRRGYNGGGGLLKGGQKGRLRFCLGKRCLEWLLGRCEAPGCGKSGGGSFEIETSYSMLLAACSRSGGKSGGGSFEIETSSLSQLDASAHESGKSGGGSFEIETVRAGSNTL